MIRRELTIGSWQVDFFFAAEDEPYDSDTLLRRLYDFGAPVHIMRRAYDIMEANRENTGFTFANPYERIAVVAIGPTTSGEEFVDTLVHEIHHLAVAIASELGIDLESEAPAYLSGDTARALAESICELGCDQCRG